MENIRRLREEDSSVASRCVPTECQETDRMRSLKGVFGIERLLSSAVSEVMAGYGVLMGAMTRVGGVDGGAIATTPASFSHQHPRRESVALLCPHQETGP